MEHAPTARRPLERLAPVAIFLFRRLLSGFVVLLGTSLIAHFIALHLNRAGAIVIGFMPYTQWLRSAIVGDFGTNAAGRPVLYDIGNAIPQTLWLVSGAAVISIILGVLVGIISAVRQYSRLDYAATTTSFVLYSIPPFIAAIMAKLYGAININNALSSFAANPVIPWRGLAIFSLIAGVFWAAVIGGSRRTRWLTLAIATIGTGLIAWLALATGWILTPRLGLVGIALVGGALAVTIVIISANLFDRRALFAALACVLMGVILYFPLQFVFASPYFGWPLIALLALLALGFGALIGWLFGGTWKERRVQMRTAAATSFVTAGLVLLDRFMAIWPHFLSSRWVNFRPVPTFGQARPGIPDNFWFLTLDTWTHLWLPTLALTLISYASYMRYTRASLTEVMSQDYVRTARAKGLPEYVVVIRHALRNALLPLATIVPIDIATLFGGAILVEAIFAIRGMGMFYLRSISMSDWFGISMDYLAFMAYLVVVGAILVTVNLIADLVYAALDPRITLFK